MQMKMAITAYISNEQLPLSTFVKKNNQGQIRMHQ